MLLLLFTLNCYSNKGGGSPVSPPLGSAPGGQSLGILLAAVSFNELGNETNGHQIKGIRDITLDLGDGRLAWTTRPKRKIIKEKIG